MAVSSRHGNKMQLIGSSPGMFAMNHRDSLQPHKPLTLSNDEQSSRCNCATKRATQSGQCSRTVYAERPKKVPKPPFIQKDDIQSDEKLGLASRHRRAIGRRPRPIAMSVVRYFREACLACGLGSIANLP